MSFSQYRYRWPVGYHLPSPPETIDSNHRSALMSHIQELIDKELSYQALVGLFNSQPFDDWARLSPVMTGPKKESVNRRVIIDLSFPECRS